MNRVLLWKEYRQQLALWLAIPILCLLLFVSLVVTMGQGSGLQVHQNESGLRELLYAIVFGLMVLHGAVTGAILLASEKEERTLVFLDGLTGLREPVWTGKVFAGILFTLSQSQVLVALSVSLGLGDWQLILLPLIGFNALAWGLLGGVLCRTVLPAVLTAIAFMAASWMFFGFAHSGVVRILGVLATAITAGDVSRRRFCRADKLRRLPTDWRVLLWLAARQGRTILIGGSIVAVVLGFSVNNATLFLWPIGTLTFGLACGLAVFTPDHQEGARFLGAQRFSPGRIWTVKILFWGTIALCFTAVVWFVPTVLRLYLAGLLPIKTDSDNLREAIAHAGEPTYWLRNWLGYRRHEAAEPPRFAVLLGLWPFYGFCVGQFFGQAARRPLLAPFVAPFVVGLWVPSLLFGGLTLWQILPIPVLLLVTTRLAMRPWLSGRLWTLRPLLGIAGAAVLMAASLVGGLWYRAVEVPDVGEPFDVKEFIASLPTQVKNDAKSLPFTSVGAVGLLSSPQGPASYLVISSYLAETETVSSLINRAVAGMIERRRLVENGLQPPIDPFCGPVVPQPVAPGLVAREEWHESIPVDYGILVKDVVAKGWPKLDKEIGVFLDRLFDGGWVNAAHRAAREPLGMMEDPRLTRSWNGRNWEGGLDDLVSLFIARAHQLQSRGDSRAALKHLETGLGLSRQAKNFGSASQFVHGQLLEMRTLNGARLWLQNVGPDKELLRAALTILQRHAAANPAPANSIKAQYLMDCDAGAEWLLRSTRGELGSYAYQVPWEKERQRRTVNALYAGHLRMIQESAEDWLARRKRQTKSNDLVGVVAESNGLPPTSGPGSNLAASRWDEFALQCWLADHISSLYELTWAYRGRQRWLAATRLVAALALFQGEHGKPPISLDELVPTYLPELPRDAFNGQPFVYRISEGEQTERADGETYTLAPGQAVIEGGFRSLIIPVPIWQK